MELRIIIGGQAGQGVQRISEVLGKAFIKTGYYVFNYRDYQSLIRGGHNYNALKISDKPVYSHSEENIDFLIALDQNTISKHFHKLKKDGYVITDKKINAERKIEIDVNKILKEVGAPERSQNVVLISALWKILGLPKDILRETVEKELGEVNAKIVDRVFEEELKVIREVKVLERKEKYFLNGSWAIALGAIAAGLDIYIAYPMTPATPVLHILARLKDKYNIVVYQPDNEIGAINMAVGASYAGAKVMVGTSGGGFALMNEALSMSGIMEVPVVIYLAQRYDPATGIPTYTLQGDMLYSIFAGHGEFPRIVVAPGDPSEAFRRTIEAFYLAYKYRVPAIILSDKHLAESWFTFDEIEKPPEFVTTERFIDLNPKDSKYYSLERIYPRQVPGVSNDIYVKANSYEHDEEGFTTEDGKIATEQMNKRLKKLKMIKEEIQKLEPYRIYNPKAKKIIISWGSTKGAILDALKKLKDFAFLQVIYLWPFPREIKDILLDYDEIILIENNATGQLGKLLRMETGLDIDRRILKYDARPFTPEDIIKSLRR